VKARTTQQELGARSTGVFAALRPRIDVRDDEPAAGEDRKLHEKQPDTTGPDFVGAGLGHDFGRIRVHAETGRKQATDQTNDPQALRSRLGVGRRLDSGVKSRMESIFGQDLSHVRVHANGQAARLSAGLDARAFAIGEHVAFGEGQYRPGTPIGDALIAHELAHVVQQEGSRSTTSTSRDALETEANTSAVGALLSVLGGAKAALSQKMMPRLRSGLQLQRCIQSQKYEIPPYLGPASTIALEQINQVIENVDLLGNFVVFGTAFNLATADVEERGASIATDVATDTPSEVELAARALSGLPAIRRERITTIITLLLVEHENDMNAQERAFWHRILESIGTEPARGER
jgi:hypothetical protein